MEGVYCLRCRDKRESRDDEEVTLKNGRPATKGVCTTCGSTVFRMKKKTEITA